MQLAQDVIDNLIARIKKVVEPREVIIFGSAASGLMAHDSDITDLPKYSERRQVSICSLMSRLTRALQLIGAE